MSTESDRAQDFVLRLIGNPALEDLSELQREEQIIQFLQANAAQLAPTLSTPQFFPGQSWNQTFTLLTEALFRLTDETLLPELRTAVASDVSFSFVPLLQHTDYQGAKIQNQIYAFVASLLRKTEARRGFTGAHAALKFKVIDRYIDEVFARKSYVHFELTKVQRLRLSKEEVRDMILATLLLKPAVYVLAAGGTGEQSRLMGTIQSAFAEKVVQALSKQLPLVPEQLVRSAVNTNISFAEDRSVEATARVAAIFAARCRNYHPHIRVDRGADTPDKSWLSVARRNYKFYGFDIKMLDEFYMIAAENGW